MLNTLKIYNQLKENMEPAAAEAIVESLTSVFEELQNSVTKTEFNELRDIVKQQGENINLLTIRMDQLTERVDDLTVKMAQLTERVDDLTVKMAKLTERVDDLTIKMAQLTERVDDLTVKMAQLTERVDDLTIKMAKLTERVDDLTVKMEKLTERVDDLTVKMEKLTERVDDLTIKMAQLTERVDDLAVRMAQLASTILRLEEKVENLVGEMKNFKEQLGGLAHTVGYRLEDESYIKLPAILERDHSVVVKGRLKRGWLELKKNKYIEINIWGQGEHFGRRVEIVGEAKSQLKKRDVDQFLQNLDMIRPHINDDIYPVCVTYQTSPTVLKYAQEKGLTLYFSYELDW